MKYVGMPSAMWLVYRKSFERNLTAVFGMMPKSAGRVMKHAKKKYKEGIDRKMQE